MLLGASIPNMQILEILAGIWRQAVVFSSFSARLGEMIFTLWLRPKAAVIFPYYLKKAQTMITAELSW